jgi:hypothetical protein
LAAQLPWASDVPANLQCCHAAILAAAVAIAHMYVSVVESSLQFRLDSGGALF